MFREERIEQFQHLLSEILSFTRLGLSIKDSGICALYSTANRFNIKEPTVRDMVTRSCNVKEISNFYNAIRQLFEGNTMEFIRLYEQYIPSNKLNIIFNACNELKNSNITPPEQSPQGIDSIIKKFVKGTPEEKHIILSELKKSIAKSQ